MSFFDVEIHFIFLFEIPFEFTGNKNINKKNVCRIIVCVPYVSILFFLPIRQQTNKQKI